MPPSLTAPAFVRPLLLNQHLAGVQAVPCGDEVAQLRAPYRWPLSQAYAVIMSSFAGAFHLIAEFAAPHLTWDEALALSISAFHGQER